MSKIQDSCQLMFLNVPNKEGQTIIFKHTFFTICLNRMY